MRPAPPAGRMHPRRKRDRAFIGAVPLTPKLSGCTRGCVEDKFSKESARAQPSRRSDPRDGARILPRPSSGNRSSCNAEQQYSPPRRTRSKSAPKCSLPVRFRQRSTGATIRSRSHSHSPTELAIEVRRAAKATFVRDLCDRLAGLLELHARVTTANVIHVDRERLAGLAPEEAAEGRGRHTCNARRLRNRKRAADPS